MKNSTEIQPRFMCRVARGSLSIFGDTTGPEPRGPGAGHVAGCEDCQSFFAVEDDFTRVLKRDAAGIARQTPAGMEERLLRAIAESAEGSAPMGAESRRRRGARWGAMAGLAGAMACAVAVFAYYQSKTPRGGTATPDGGVSVAGQDWTTLQPSAEALLTGEVLQNEADAMLSDAQSAMRFLERNFLLTPEPTQRSG